MKKDFLSITDLSPKEIWEVITLAKKMKKNGQFKPVLENKTLVMIFEKPSLRTRLSFETGMKQLGGNAVYLTGKEIGIGSRESFKDIAKVISSMADTVMARTFQHETISELAKYAEVPVINGLSDLEHPCQILADLLTIYEIKGKIFNTSPYPSPDRRGLKGLKLAFIGDGENNVCHSLALACAMLGIDFVAASPNGYFMKPTIFVKAKQLAWGPGARILQLTNPYEAVKDADIVYTDTWISMGDEKEAKKRVIAFKDYQVTTDLMKLAKNDAIFMHDMPAHRGKEVAVEVIDGSQSVIYQQAENRLHVQKGLLIKLLGKELYV